MASSSGCARRAGRPSSLAAARRDASVSRLEAALSDQRFPRHCRLTQRRQYQGAYKYGRRIGSSSFALFGIPNTEGQCRVGITATRKVGGAVRRNRAKRVLREVFRRNRSTLRPPLDIVIHVYPSITGRTTAELEREFLDCFARLARGIAR